MKCNFCFGLTLNGTFQHESRCPENLPIPVEYNCNYCKDTGTLVGGSGCEDCCEHNELDHFICMDCGKEMDPGVYIDRAMERYED